MFRFWRRFASRRPADPRTLALEALARRDFDLAERELTALLDDAAAPPPPPERAFLHNKRGVARAGQKRPELARTDFEAALACVGRYPPALTNLGNLLLESGETDAAIEHYEKAILSDPDYAVAHFNLGVACKRAGRTGEAVRALRKAQQLEGRRPRRPTNQP